jgi:hypothetical protein
MRRLISGLLEKILASFLKRESGFLKTEHHRQPKLPTLLVVALIICSVSVAYAAKQATNVMKQFADITKNIDHVVGIYFSRTEPAKTELHVEASAELKVKREQQKELSEATSKTNAKSEVTSKTHAKSKTNAKKVGRRKKPPASASENIRAHKALKEKQDMACAPLITAPKSSEPAK